VSHTPVVDPWIERVDYSDILVSFLLQLFNDPIGDLLDECPGNGPAKEAARGVTNYNEYLINHGKNVSRNSLHLRGIAIDFAIEGMGNNKLSGLAKSFMTGGVGKYPEFVHIDVGRVRYW